MFARLCRILVLIVCCGSYPELSAQKYDYTLDDLYTLGPASEDRAAVTASVKIQSDGAFLILYIHVRDPQIRVERDWQRSDHVILSLALPADAYPSDFEYDLHPSYILAPVLDQATSTAPRLFSWYADGRPSLSTEAFIQNHDYPRRSEARVPAGNTLQEGTVPFGLVHFALFPDGRPARWINQEEMDPVEAALGAKLGALAGGISYEVVPQDADSYELHVRVSPTALGFVTLPEMADTRFLLRIYDAVHEGEPAQAILSTQPEREMFPMLQPRQMNQLHLERPLYTNYSIAPDYLFHQVDYHPLGVYAAQGWMAARVDVDALVYREQEASRSLTEIGIYPETFQYRVDQIDETIIEILSVDMSYVNELPKQKKYFLVQEQSLQTQLVRSVLSDPVELPNQFFRFPDGELGSILRSNASVDPYGWGPCGTCMEEIIRIWRITKNEKKVLLDIYQGDGPNAYCQIGEILLKGYYIDTMDWIRKGQILVLRMNHRYLTTKKRIKVSWEADGADVVVELMD